MCIYPTSPHQIAAGAPGYVRGFWKQVYLEASLRRSRWFTRGWTLQELLAPPTIILYSAQREEIGNQRSLAPLIHDITSIPISALLGHSLEKFTQDERMSWANGRRTTKVEDIAYCLLGLSDIFIPLLYGEGEQRALRRLQHEIDKPSILGRSFCSLIADLADIWR